MTPSAGSPSDQWDAPLGQPVAELLERLRRIRSAIDDARSCSMTPAVERALDLTEAELFLAMTYLGHTDELFPGEDR